MTDCQDRTRHLAPATECIPDYKINRIDELLPWNRAPTEDREAEA